MVRKQKEQHKNKNKMNKCNASGSILCYLDATSKDLPSETSVLVNIVYFVYIFGTVLFSFLPSFVRILILYTCNKAQILNPLSMYS